MFFSHHTLLDIWFVIKSYSVHGAVHTFHFSFNGKGIQYHAIKRVKRKKNSPSLLKFFQFDNLDGATINRALFAFLSGRASVVTIALRCPYLRARISSFTGRIMFLGSRMASRFSCVSMPSSSTRSYTLRPVSKAFLAMFVAWS